MTALNGIKESITSLQKNKDFIQKQREFWENKLYTVFEEISKIMKQKFNDLDEKIHKLFNRVQKFNNVSFLSYGSLKSRLEYYLNLTENTFELDIARANRMIIPTLRDWNDLVHLNPQMFNFEESQFLNIPVEKFKADMEKFEFVPSKNTKLRELKKYLGLVKPKKKNGKSINEDSLSLYAAVSK